MTDDEGTTADDATEAMVDQIRRRYEQDGLMLAGTVRKHRPEVLHRAATLALEEMQAGPTPATWESARTRPYASEELDDPRDVLIGRLAAILGVVDGGYHPASFPAMLAAARRLQAELAARRAATGTAPPGDVSSKNSYAATAARGRLSADDMTTVSRSLYTRLELHA